MTMKDPRFILITRETRLDALVKKYNTFAQARFYIEHLGADFEDYVTEDDQYKTSVSQVEESILQVGKLQRIDRTFLSNYVFSGDEYIVVVGQDGLVANTLKYIKSQPVIAVNPDHKRYDGVLLPFNPNDTPVIIKEFLEGKRLSKEISLAKASLSNGQEIVGVNDIFIGPKSHTSAQYRIQSGEESEIQSSSGVIISTGLGSTGWFQSILAGAQGVLNIENKRISRLQRGFSWDSDFLHYSVREPFPSNVTGTDIVFGRITDKKQLILESHMPENGIIFSDGILEDNVEFHSGIKATVGMAEWKSRLVW